MASTSLSGAGRGGQGPLPPANMPPEPQGQTEEQQQGERPKMSFKSAALKLVSAASAFWMMKRGVQPHSVAVLLINVAAPPAPSPSPSSLSLPPVVQPTR
jgi:hypothetical protein